MAKKTGKTTRKKASPTRKKTPRAVPKTKPKLIESVVAVIVHQMVIDAMTDDEIRAKNKGDELIEEYILEARSRLARASTFDRAAEIGAGISRLKAVYSMAYVSGELTAAISAQTQISKLLALYPKESKGDAPSDPAQLDLIEQIEQHLRPLGLASDEYPIVEIARIAAEKIRMLEAGHGGD